MSTTTTTLEARDAVGEETAGGGLLDRAFRRFMAGREARARGLVEAHLSRLPDASLVELGYELGEIRRIRARAGTSAAYWF